MFVRERQDILNEAGNIILDEGEISNLLSLHEVEKTRLNKLYHYYTGEHPILSRTPKSASMPNNRVMVNHAKYITDICTGYMVGTPISYTGEQLDAMLALYKAAHIYGHDTALEKKASVFGHAFELVYAKPEGQAGFAVIDPRQAFLVVDDSVEQRPLLGVRYYTVGNKTKLFLYSDLETAEYIKQGTTLTETCRYRNLFGMIPLVRYDNNEEATADFEDVLSLIDAYNILASDRVNDKEQFVNCLLVLTNCNIDSAAYNKVKEWGVMALNGEGRAEYLTKTLNESDTDVLRKGLEEDLHKISMVPALSDSHFSGNVSGLAMEYKLLGFEQKIKIKERFFVKGLEKRIELISRLLELQAQPTPQGVEAVFTRSMPLDTSEVADIVNKLTGLVSRETLLAQLPFIVNVEQEMARLDTEQQRAAQQQLEQATKLEPGEEKNAPGW